MNSNRKFTMMKYISKFALLILIIGILILLLSGNLLSKSQFIIAGQLIAITIGIWARRSFQTGQFNINAEPREGKLLITGPYRYIRHPMYAAALLLIWSSIIGHLHPLSIVVGLIITFVIAVRIKNEDIVLRGHFIKYAEYARTTKRIIPFVI